MAQVSIQTTQNVNVNYQIADIGDRVLGWVVDACVKIAYLIIFYGFVFTYLFGGGRSTLIIFLFFIPPVFYTLLMEYFFNGQTIGKMSVHTKVIRLDGGEAKLGNYIIRWLFKIVDDSFFIGLIVAAVSDKGQRIGDMVAGTTVIKLKNKEARAESLPEIPEEEDYHIVFPQISKLSDNDVRIIRETFANAIRSGNYLLIESLSRKTKEVLGINSSMSDIEFIRTILKDYSFYHSDPANTFANRE